MTEPSAAIEGLTEALQDLSLSSAATLKITSAFLNAVTATTAQAARRDLNDHLRTVAAVLKPTKPKPYEGAIDAVACLNFIENQEEYYGIVNLDNSEWVKYTAVNLEGDAKAWWRNSSLTLDSTWEDFRKAFIEYFTPPDTVGAARLELNKLRQGKLSVADYTTKFRRLTRLIPNMDQESITFLYTHGLEPSTSKEVRLRQPGSLDEAIRQATILHSILHPVAPTIVTVPSAPAKQPSSTEPMDIDNLHVLLANLMNATAINAMKRPLGKLTTTERDRLRRIGACYRCRRTGHIATECRSGRAMNNLGTGTPSINQADDESGKDQGEL